MNEENKVNEKNVKLYSILSYIGILWIVGILVKEKDNKTVKFHVGQGMLLTIMSVAISIINRLVIANVFTTTKYIFGVPYTTISGFGLLIEFVLYALVFVLMIIGIINASKEKEEELPVIGQFAFYK